MNYLINQFTTTRKNRLNYSNYVIQSMNETKHALEYQKRFE